MCDLDETCGPTETIKRVSTTAKECDVYTKRISSLNDRSVTQDEEMEAIKRKLDRERILKRAAVRNLTRLMFLQKPNVHSVNVVDRDGVERRAPSKVNLSKFPFMKIDVIQDENDEMQRFQEILEEHEKTLKGKEMQLAAMNDEATRLIRKYQRNKVNIEALELGIVDEEGATAETSSDDGKSKVNVKKSQSECKKSENQLVWFSDKISY